jgi:hypothetical protein
MNNAKKLLGLSGLAGALALPIAVPSTSQAGGRPCSECTDEYNECHKNAESEFYRCMSDASDMGQCYSDLNEAASNCHNAWNSCWIDCTY